MPCTLKYILDCNNKNSLYKINLYKTYLYLLIKQFVKNKTNQLLALCCISATLIGYCGFGITTHGMLKIFFPVGGRGKG